MQKRLSGYDISIATAILLEIILLFNTKNLLGQTANSILYALCSISIGILLLLKYYNKDVESVREFSSGMDRKIFYFFVAALLIYIVISDYNIIIRNPISLTKSDIIPSVQLMVKRFIAGEYVYTPTNEFGYLLYPTYLPLHWMPYTIAELAHFDYRWISLLIWIIVSAILFVRLNKNNRDYIKIFIPVFVFVLYLSILNHEKMFFAHTVEIMVAGYYILLIIALNQSSTIMTAIVFTLCLLSRFSLVLWLPLWFFSMFASGNIKVAFRVTGIVLVLIACIYIIPFLSKDWSIFSNSMKHYSGAALGEWQHLSIFTWKPYQLYAGTGFAHLFYESLQDWELADKIKRLQKVHFLVSMGITVVMGIWYWFNRKKIHPRIFLMASFKIYFTIFLAFIQVPYIYLMIVANFVSIAIFSEQMRYKITTSKV